MQKKIILNSKIGGAFKEVSFANRNHLVFNALTIEGDTVMNRILYPLEVVKASFQNLDNLPAPLGHPTFNGEPLDPNSPVARNQFDIGAFVKEPRMDGKKVFNSIYIDEVRALESEKGQVILNKAKSGERLGVSTGGVAKLTPQKTEHYDYVVNELKYDHVAILDGETPAGASTYFQNADVEIIDLDTVDIIHNSSTTQEEISMDKSKLINAVVQNSAFKGNAAELEDLSESQFAKYLFANTVQEVSYEDALAVVEAKGQRVTNHSKEDLAEFEAFKVEKAKIRNEKIEAIVSNNDQFTKDELELMADATLEKIENSIKKTADYSAQAQVVTNSDKDFEFGEGL